MHPASVDGIRRVRRGGAAGRGYILALAALAGLLPGLAAAQTMTDPLILGVTQPIKDEYGKTLKGGDQNPQELVMILWATNQIIDPPNLDGTPSTRNAMAEGGTADVGDNTVMQGMFSWYYPTDVSEQPKSGYLFMRVFNKPTLEEASFYQDSIPLDLSKGRSLNDTIHFTDRPLDTADPDGDGLHNSWEKSEGTDPLLKDTDDDTQSDWEEWVAGTDGADDTSFFIVARLRPGNNDQALLGWASVPGRHYVVYYSEDPLDATEPPPEYMVVSGLDPIVADSEFTEIPIPGGLSVGHGHFRITVERP